MNYMMDSLKEANNNQSSNSGSNSSTVMKSKGKRTKRQRIQQLALLTDPSLSTMTSSSSTESSSSTTEEEEDMANCLILLAQGHGLNATPDPPTNELNNSEKFTSRRYSETDGGLYVYECKTCNRCFSSFQALGGHRASHKKLKLADEKNLNIVGELDGLQINMNSLAKPGANHNSSSNKNRVHQCSICGAEFSSGQALGGHMRRHRPLNVSTEVKNEEYRSVLSLDLNLPAPDDDEGHLSTTMEFPVAAFETKQPLVFSVSALVDCHY